MKASSETPDGLTIFASALGPKETMNRLAAAVAKRAMTVFARVDHAAGAEQAGMSLRPTEVLIFGSPKGGTPLMQAGQTIGIDLPLKALVWQDDDGKTWLAYNDPGWLAARHGIGSGAQQAVEAMTAALAGVAKEATAA